MQEAIKQPPTLAQLRAQREEILRVAAAHRVSNVRVFGSVARGDADAGSDVDLMVDLPSDVRGFRAFGLLEDLRRDIEAVVGRPVDVVTLAGPFSHGGARVAASMRGDAVAL